MSKQFGLIGKKLGHSFSKDFFEKKFQLLNLDATYRNFELERIEDVKSLFADPTIEGLNVTIPYKQSFIPFLDSLDPVAERVGAVNCIQLKNGKSKGFNTDVFGFSQAIKPFLESHHERALILGTGGASRAVEFVLAELGLAVFFISRHPKNDNEFAWSDINENMVQSCGIIVNTTPVGMFPEVNQCPEFPFEYLNPTHLVMDLIYNPKETELLKRAKAAGASVINGESMLFQQAEKSWEIWNS
ncbi:MAG: shikimate dehydrogenase [Crocinitomicaceae bacterium]|nr:shikimate dehydrogenase [Crocinitomicaceae bacterium]